MKKKEIKKGTLLNAEITKKTTLKKELIEGVIASIVATVIVYVTVVTYNYEIRLLLRAVNEAQIKPLEVIIWSFLVILLVSSMIRLGDFLISYSKKK